MVRGEYLLLRTPILAKHDDCISSKVFRSDQASHWISTAENIVIDISHTDAKGLSPRFFNLGASRPNLSDMASVKKTSLLYSYGEQFPTQLYYWETCSKFVSTHKYSDIEHGIVLISSFCTTPDGSDTPIIFSYKRFEYEDINIVTLSRNWDVSKLMSRTVSKTMKAEPNTVQQVAITYEQLYFEYERRYNVMYLLSLGHGFLSDSMATVLSSHQVSLFIFSPPSNCFEDFQEIIQHYHI